jgi:hypothetical protein
MANCFKTYVSQPIGQSMQAFYASQQRFILMKGSDASAPLQN